MPTDDASAGDGYLHRLLSDGARPFRYRSRLRALLGSPEPGGVQIRFLPPLPLAGFAYLRRGFAGEFDSPGGFAADQQPQITYTEEVSSQWQPHRPGDGVGAARLSPDNQSSTQRHHEPTRGRTVAAPDNAWQGDVEPKGRTIAASDEAPQGDVAPTGRTIAASDKAPQGDVAPKGRTVAAQDSAAQGNVAPERRAVAALDSAPQGDGAPERRGVAALDSAPQSDGAPERRTVAASDNVAQDDVPSQGQDVVIPGASQRPNPTSENNNVRAREVGLAK